MLMLLFFLALAGYFILRGGTEAGFWAGNTQIQGILMLAAGVFLFLAQIL